MVLLTLVCGGILGVKAADPFYKGLHPSLLKETHQGRFQGFAGVGGDFGYGSLGTEALLDVAAGNLFELEIARDVGGDEDVGQFARRHEELGDEIDVPVVGPTVLFPWLVTFFEVAILLE